MFAPNTLYESAKKPLSCDPYLIKLARVGNIFNPTQTKAEGLTPLALAMQNGDDEIITSEFLGGHGGK